MPRPYEVITTVQDQAAKSSTSTLYVASGLTQAQYEEGLQALAQLIDPVLSGRILALRYAIPVDISGLTGNIAAGTSDVEEVGQFIFRTANNDPVEVNLPCINDTASAAGSDDLDQADANIAAFISMMEDGLAVTGGTIIPTDFEGIDIASVETARERVRNSGKRR